MKNLQCRSVNFNLLQARLIFMAPAVEGPRGQENVEPKVETKAEIAKEGTKPDINTYAGRLKIYDAYQERAEKLMAQPDQKSRDRGTRMLADLDDARKFDKAQGTEGKNPTEDANRFYAALIRLDKPKTGPIMSDTRAAQVSAQLDAFAADKTPVKTFEVSANADNIGARLDALGQETDSKLRANTNTASEVLKKDPQVVDQNTKKVSGSPDDKKDKV